MKIKSGGQLRIVKGINININKRNKRAIQVLVRLNGKLRIGWNDTSTPPKVVGIENVEV